MRGNRGTRTSPEQRLATELWSRGLRYRRGKRIDLISARVRPDFVFSGKRLAVFVDGCFWHRCPEHGTSPRTNASYWEAKLGSNLARDKRVRSALVVEGWTVLAVWEHELPSEAATRIVGALGGARLLPT